MIPSLDILYIIGRTIEFLSTVPLSQSAVVSQLIFYINTVVVIGMVLSFILLAFIMYARIRLVQVEHHGFHVKAEAEELHRRQEVEAAKNPRWEMVLGLAASPNEGDWRRAILEADSMLAAMLTEKGFSGDGVGEQLKGANELQFTTLNAAWEAHRMRNAVAHLGEAFPITDRDLRTTIDQYRRVFEEFQYI